MTSTPTPDDVDQWWDTLPTVDTPAVPSTPPTPEWNADAMEARRDWADALDENLDRAPQSTPRARTRALRLSPRFGIAAALATVLVGGVGWTAIGGRGGDTAPIAEPIPVSATASTEVEVSPPPPDRAAGGCPARVEGAAVIGATRGDSVSGPGAILAFEAAYYLDRSGVRARAVTTPDAALPSAEAIQAGIDTVPAGTTHCVRITPDGPERWAVELTEQRPGQPAQIYLQTITTRLRDGRVLLTGITSR